MAGAPGVATGHRLRGSAPADHDLAPAHVRAGRVCPHRRRRFGARGVSAVHLPGAHCCADLLQAAPLWTGPRRRFLGQVSRAEGSGTGTSGRCLATTRPAGRGYCGRRDDRDRSAQSDRRKDRILRESKCWQLCARWRGSRHRRSPAVSAKRPHRARPGSDKSCLARNHRRWWQGCYAPPFLRHAMPARSARSVPFRTCDNALRGAHCVPQPEPGSDSHAYPVAFSPASSSSVTSPTPASSRPRGDRGSLTHVASRGRGDEGRERTLREGCRQATERPPTWAHSEGLETPRLWFLPNVISSAGPAGPDGCLMRWPPRPRSVAGITASRVLGYLLAIPPGVLAVGWEA